MVSGVSRSAGVAGCFCGSTGSDDGYVLQPVKGTSKKVTVNTMVNSLVTTVFLFKDLISNSKTFMLAADADFFKRKYSAENSVLPGRYYVPAEVSVAIIKV